MSSKLMVNGLTIQNSPQFHIKFDGWNEVRKEKLSISSPALSPNTDDIHIENTKSVAIYNSIVANGDDCISIGTGCSDVNIENVTCGPSYGIRMKVGRFVGFKPGLVVCTISSFVLTNEGRPKSSVVCQ